MEAILFGNGFNLLTKNENLNPPSWTELLTHLSKNESPVLEDIPPVLQYEQVYLNRAEDKKESELKDEIKKKLSGFGSNVFYDRLLKLGVTALLTTNYDHAFYRKYETQIVAKNHKETTYSIKRWKKVRIDDTDYTIFHIHGDIDHKKSIMLGLEHYGGSLAKVQDYVKGYFTEKTEDNKIHQDMDGRFSIYKRLTSQPATDSTKEKFEPDRYGFTDNGTGLISWIDAFFFSNLHIIGFGMDFSEIDIWWLLSRRARLMKKGSINNRIYYYSTDPIPENKESRSRNMLLEQMGVKVVYHTQPLINGEKGPNYNDIYFEQIENIRKNINKEG